MPHLLHYFDNICNIWCVAIVFILAWIEYAKKEMTMKILTQYGAYIVVAFPYKFLINRHRSWFFENVCQSRKMKLTICNKYTVKKIIFLMQFHLTSLKSIADDDDSFYPFREVVMETCINTICRAGVWKVISQYLQTYMIATAYMICSILMETNNRLPELLKAFSFRIFSI